MAGEGRLVNENAVHMALRAVRELRFNVANTFEYLVRGQLESSGDSNPTFLEQTSQHLKRIESCMKNLKKAVDTLVPPLGPLSLSNGGMLSTESNEEQATLYFNMIRAYKWIEKLHLVSTRAQNILVWNGLMRTQDKKSVCTGNNKLQKSPMQKIDDVMKAFQLPDTDIQIKAVRTYGTLSTILLVTLGKTLKAVLVLRGSVIEHVIVRAHSEEFLTEDGEGPALCDHAVN